jgi:cytochrome c553
MVVEITLRRGVAAIVGLLVFGMLVAWLGIINIAASTGHWMITDKFLHWSMRNAVRTRSALTVEDSSLDPTGLISAAGHYATTCALCHGAPGERPSVVMQATTPPAPNLTVTASEWSDRQLLWIVKHGVKFTPMPAWPTQQRNDEVRRMAAFVRRLPGMTPGIYRELAYGSGRIGGSALTRVDDAFPDCERCHADDGRERPDIPLLAGQKQDYLLAALAAYAAGKRASGVMGTQAARLDRETMRALARRYAASAPAVFEYDASSAPPAEDDAARHIVEHGLPDAKLPACVNCHARGKRPDYPLLAGQRPEYLAARLRRWRGDAGVVDARKPNESMAMIARRIPEDLIEPLARYYSRYPVEP